MWWEVIKALKQSRDSPSEYANNVCLWGDKTTKLIKICSNSSWGRFFWKASLREEREPLNVCSWTTLFPHWNAQFESYFALYDPNGRWQENNFNTNHRMKLKCWYRSVHAIINRDSQKSRNHLETWLCSKSRVTVQQNILDSRQLQRTVKDVTESSWDTFQQEI